MLEINYITVYSAHTPGCTYTCEDRRNWKPSPPFPIVHCRDHFSNFTCKRVSVPISEHPKSIKCIHQDLSFRGCQIADNKLD